MCNIQFVKKMGGTVGAEELVILQTMLARSAYSNSHGWGVLTNKKYYKSPDPYKWQELDEFVGGDFLIGHNRLATSGKKDIPNSHPIICKDVKLIHNGVFPGIGTKKKSDSVIMCEKIWSTYKIDRNPIKAILENLGPTSGYSCFIYFSDKDELYYAKDMRSNFTFTLHQEIDELKKPVIGGQRYIIGATIEKNLKPAEVANGFYIEHQGITQVGKFEPETEVLYKITDEGIHAVKDYSDDYPYSYTQ